MVSIAEIASLGKQYRSLVKLGDYSQARTKLKNACEKKRENVRHAFAELNGWKYGGKRFTLDALARGLVHGGGDPYNPEPGWFEPHLFPTGDICAPAEVIDHSEFFRDAKRPHRAMAIVAHNYAPADRDRTQEICQVYGFAQHRPLLANASWHAPGKANLIVFTRPDVEVTFLPEQLNPNLKFDQ